MHPAQQQGRRFPAISSSRVLSMWFLLVFGFLVEIVQQIHSFRASGVISSHAALAFGVEVRAFFKSAGNLCTVVYIGEADGEAVGEEVGEADGEGEGKVGATPKLPQET